MQKKWLTLGVIGVALVLIPRRSSRKDTTATIVPPTKDKTKSVQKDYDNHQG